MNFFVEFYKGLDTVNLIIFWGVIIVVLLLLIFAIIIARKNHKLERIIIENGIDLDDYDDDLAIKRQIPEEKVIEKAKEEPIKEINKQLETKEDISTKEINKQFESKEDMPIIKDNKINEVPIQEEKFIAEEHVMEYHREHNMPYQRNTLKENANQTSPIGISVRHSNSEQEIAKARELHDILKEDTLPPEKSIPPKKDPVSESHLLNQRNYANTYKEPVRRGNYLDELSKKMSQADSDIKRTDYELKEEEDAIISYQELMEKKDSIKTIDEEDAVISIDELIAKKKEQERIYNITKEEENEDFIKELKDFRSDL